jgi:hypothetical protein
LFWLGFSKKINTRINGFEGKMQQRSPGFNLSKTSKAAQVVFEVWKSPPVAQPSEPK